MGHDKERPPEDELTVTQDERERARSKDRSEELPEVVGYDIKKRLGTGSYGEVWLAVQKNTGREVAIKVFFPLQRARLATAQA